MQNEFLRRTAVVRDVPLPNPTIVANSVDDGGANVSTPFPIIFHGQGFTSISLGYNGAILFPSGQAELALVDLATLPSDQYGTGVYFAGEGHCQAETWAP